MRGASTVKLDELGFPIPEGFDNEPIGPSPVFSKGNLLVAVLLGVVAVGACLAIEFGPRVVALAKQQVVRQQSRLSVERARQNLRGGSFREALDDCARAIELEPTNLEAYRLRAGLLGKLHRYEEAAADYARVIQLQPENAGAYNNRAYNLALAGKQLERALEDVETALELHGPDANFLDTRGYLLYLLDRPDEALADLDSAIEMIRRRPRLRSGDGAGEIYYHRALVHQKLGNRDLSEVDFRRARQLGYQVPLPV